LAFAPLGTPVAKCAKNLTRNIAILAAPGRTTHCIIETPEVCTPTYSRPQHRPTQCASVPRKRSGRGEPDCSSFFLKTVKRVFHPICLATVYQRLNDPSPGGPAEKLGTGLKGTQMSKTMLAVGAWRDCKNLVVSATINGWTVLRAKGVEEVNDTVNGAKVDLILLSGCSLDNGWEHTARRIWCVDGNTPIIAVGANRGHEWLVHALVSGQNESSGDSPSAPPLRGSHSLDRPTLVGIQRSLDFIHKNFAEPIGLADAAGAAAYSRCHFCKLFKQHMGLSFVAYLTGLRISHARRLLEHTDLPVTSIAYEVGFNDLSHFERVFRSSVRKSPSQYRNHTKDFPITQKHPPSVPALTMAI